MFLYLVLSNRSIQCIDILLFDIYMIKEALFQLIDTTIYILRIQWEVLVSIKHNNVLEAQFASFMTLDKFLKYWCEG